MKQKCLGENTVPSEGEEPQMQECRNAGMQYAGTETYR